MSRRGFYRTKHEHGTGDGGGSPKIEAASAEGESANRRDPHVWVLPMARILEIVRGTPIDAPAQGGAPAGR